MKVINQLRYGVADTFRRTKVPGIMDQLDKSQWWDRNELEGHQFDLMKQLLIHCSRNVPYYRELFKREGIRVEKISTPADLLNIPILTKEIIRENYDSFRAADFRRYIPRPKTTGGSTGQPITVFEDKASHSYRIACNMRSWKAFTGYTPGDRFITIAHGSLLPKNNSFKNRVYFFFQNSDLITSYHLDEARLYEAVTTIRHSRGRLLYGYSSAILLIARFARKNKLDLNSRLRAIFTTADMMYPDQRALIREVFATEVFDTYGCPESGLMSFECEHHNGYHLNPESAFTEVIRTDEAGLGKIISTPLYNYAFPLIRYDTGDIGKLSSDRCKCGRWLPRITELGGRIRDFIVLKDGRYIHGAFFNHFKPFYQNDWINEYQVIQEDPGRLTIKVQTRRPPLQEEMDFITAQLKKGLLDDLEVNFDLGGVEYTRGGKFRLVISKVPTMWE